MKVLMISDAGNIHTKRWALALQNEGIDLVLFSITLPDDDFYQKNHIKLYTFDLFKYKQKTGLSRKFSNVSSHISAVSRLKEVIKMERPDILHAHYATSYGLIAALSGFHPYVISVWGSDVYEYPYKSLLNRKLVKFVLERSDRILSTSNIMALQTRKFCDRAAGITPFGVDTGKFRPIERKEPQEPVKKITFGTVKTLSYKYGIDLTIIGFAAFVESHPEIDSELVIAGKGKDRESLEFLAQRCHVDDKVTFLGEVEHDRLPELYSSFDIAVFLSREESFGVSVIEAMSCGCPVVVSDADGFKEIVENGKNGIIIPKMDCEAAANAMGELAFDVEKRKVFSKAGRKHVIDLYEWRGNVRTMIDEYRDILSSGW